MMADIIHSGKNARNPIGNFPVINALAEENAFLAQVSLPQFA